MARFVDRAVLHLQAGDGGHGCASVHREKFKPLGGPDGGDGGNGGDVTLVVDDNVHTLLDFHFRPHAKAGNGRPGQGDDKDGANGEGLELRVPSGHRRADRGRRRAGRPGRCRARRYVAARGGRGGLGNARAGLPGPQGARLRAARRARRGRGRHPGTEVGGRRRAGRLPERREVVAGVGAVRGPAEDRRLPVHHAGTQPRRGHRRFRGLHHRRRARADPRRQPGQGPWAGVPPAYRALLGAGARRRLRHLRGRPRPAVRHHGARVRAGRVHPVAGHRPGRQAAAGGAEQDRRARRPGSSPSSSGPTSRRPATGCSRSPPPPTRAWPSCGSRWPRWSPRTGPPSRPPPAPRIVVRPQADRLRAVPGRARSRGRRRLHGPRRPPGALDPADRLQQRRGRRVPGRPAGPARRRGAAGRARRPARARR